MLENWLNQIHCGDAESIMSMLPKESVDLVVTSPPYNIRNSVGNGFHYARGGKWENAGLVVGYDTHNDNMPYDQYVTWQRRCLDEMMRLIKPNGAIFYNHKWRVQGGVLQNPPEDITNGLPVRQIIIWQRAGGVNFNAGYFLPTYEVIYLIAKHDFKLAKGANKIGDVWTVNQEMHNSHPAPFPEEIARRCIESTNAQVVLDPFIGSGTTAVVADRLGRDWIGIDISEKYCQSARDRVNASRQAHNSTEAIAA